MDISLRRPFDGDYPITFVFGAWPDDERIQNQYRQWGLSGHNGIDYGLPEGTEVLAADSGRVIQSGENGDFGISVTIKHSWGESLYAHLQETKVTVDQDVTPAEVIGLSGQSGNAHGAHLHFAIKPNDADNTNGYLGYINPSSYFQSEEAKQPEGKVKIIEKEVIKEVPVEKIVEKEVIKEVVKEPTPQQIESAVKEKLHQQLVKANERKRQLHQERLEKILAYIREHQKVTNREIRKLFPFLSESTVTNYADELEEKGLIKQVGSRERAFYQPV